MDINRNQYFFAGLVVLFLGLQFQFIHSMVLTPPCTKLVGGDNNQPVVAASNPLGGLMATSSASASRVVEPPEWIAWALVSLGAVLILHSLAMPKPG